MPRWTIFYAIGGIIFLAVIWCLVPNPELLVSILVRFFAFGIAVFISVRFREWKILFLAAMFLLMALRQVLTFLIWTNELQRGPLVNALSELPGFVVTILSLVSILYLGSLLNKNAKLLELKDANIRTLNSLLPMCSKCRKIKDDDGYWNDLEAYIESNTDSQFSHGLCEKCSDELYGDQEWYQKSKAKRRQMAKNKS
ncbi:hypothetical protein [Maridesulfovibrio salexigens]|uniref:Uncharacterized protein n=1 Tax=Maridesulfovibrio salexigens (strain ATCC 14822 / DSM 2638 / NCIMB 8403 / VKM B-1763) TaxID=526222 RepID=C6C1U7_MARSD|nr:hypothetical protein [Maridesulfovibrio salexigens]ACS79343.1 hypothetical protein Desal_1280 [Maridesulfovibrio salexigens DSM 2638]